MKLLLLTLLIFVTGCQTISSIFTTDLPTLAQDLKPNICQVLVQAEEETVQNSILDFILGDQVKEESTRFAPSQMGTCFVVNYGGDKQILTNSHVVTANDPDIRIRFEHSLVTYKVDIVAQSEVTDIALLTPTTTEGEQKIDELPGLLWRDSDTVQTGEQVFAIGHPFGMEFSITTGVVSRVNFIRPDSNQLLIQTDAAINQGNSGGPLFDDDGNVIGINTFILSKNNTGSIGIGFSVVANQVKRHLEQLLTVGHIERALMGIMYVENYDAGRIEIIDLVKAGSASIAGVKVGDLMLSIDGHNINTTRDLLYIMNNIHPGDYIKIDVLRDESIHQYNIKTTS